jgi:GTPase SAR1 family protein
VRPLSYRFELLRFCCAESCLTSLPRQIWDTAGQERFRTITASFFRSSQGIMLVYDVTDRGSFTAVRGWMKQIELVWLLPFLAPNLRWLTVPIHTTQHVDVNVSKILIGNKCDLEKERVSMLLCSLSYVIHHRARPLLCVIAVCSWSVTRKDKRWPTNSTYLSLRRPRRRT